MGEAGEKGLADLEERIILLRRWRPREKRWDDVVVVLTDRYAFPMGLFQDGDIGTVW